MTPAGLGLAIIGAVVFLASVALGMIIGRCLRYCDQLAGRSEEDQP